MKPAAVHDEHAALSGLTRAAQELLDRPASPRRASCRAGPRGPARRTRRGGACARGSRRGPATRPSMNSSESERSNGASPATSARSASMASRSGCQNAPAARRRGRRATRPGPRDRAGARPRCAAPRARPRSALARAPEVGRGGGAARGAGGAGRRERLQLVEGVVEGLLAHRATITAGIVDIEIQCPYCGEWVTCSSIPAAARRRPTSRTARSAAGRGPSTRARRSRAGSRSGSRGRTSDPAKVG